MYGISHSDEGILKLELHIGTASKEIQFGESGSWSDNNWHSVQFKRRGMIMTLGVDQQTSTIGKASLPFVDNFASYSPKNTNFLNELSKATLRSEHI